MMNNNDNTSSSSSSSNGGNNINNTSLSSSSTSPFSNLLSAGTSSSSAVVGGGGTPSSNSSSSINNSNNNNGNNLGSLLGLGGTGAGAGGGASIVGLPPLTNSTAGLSSSASASSSAASTAANLSLFGFSGLSSNTAAGGSIGGLTSSSSSSAGFLGSAIGNTGGVPAISSAGLNMNATGLGGLGGGGGSTTTGGSERGGGVDELLPLVVHLTNPEQREGVLLELSKKRESFSDLAPILWHTYGTVAALLQEIVSIYPLLSPPTLTAHASNRVCNALALLQCVASHPDTRSLFLSAHVPLYLYPFLNTQSKSRPFEYLRLTSLGVVGALVKMDDSDVINFLLQTEIIPLCLRIMETGSELSKTVATFIVQKILLDETGLKYVCATAERFYAVSAVLNNMVALLVMNPSVRLLKHIVRCYLRLSDNVKAREALRRVLPRSLRDDTFGNALLDDVTVKKWLSQLLSNVGPPVNNPGGNAGGGGLMDGSINAGGGNLDGVSNLGVPVGSLDFSGN